MDRKVPVARLIPVGALPGVREEPGEYVVANQELEDEAKLARLEGAGVIVPPALTGSAVELDTSSQIRNWRTRRSSHGWRAPG